MNHYFTHFDELFTMLDELSPVGSFRELIPAERKAQVCTMPSFPHSNVWLSPDTNTLSMEFALAGYSEDEIAVTADDGVVNVSVNPREETIEAVHIHHGIARRSANFSVRIDKAFDARKAETSFKDGILGLRMCKAKECQTTQLM